MIHFVNSTDVVVERVTLRNSPMFHVRTENSARQVVRHVVVRVDVHRQARLRRRRATGARAVAGDGAIVSAAARAWRRVTDALWRRRDATTGSFALEAERGVFDDLPYTFPLNTDGIDVGGRDIHVHDCDVENFDDAVAVKPSRGGRDASESNPVLASCTENVLVEDVRVANGLGMSVGSVSPHRDVNCVRNVTFRRVNFTRPFKAIYVKTETAEADDPGDPATGATGVVEGVLYESIRVENPRWIPVYVGPQQMFRVTAKTGATCMADPLACVTEPRVRVSDVTLRDVEIRGGLAPSVMVCDAAAPCRGVVLERVTRVGWPMGARDCLVSGRGHTVNASRISWSKLGPYACPSRLWASQVTVGN
jgi:hypothetical protein